MASISLCTIFWCCCCYIMFFISVFIIQLRLIHIHLDKCFCHITVATSKVVKPSLCTRDTYLKHIINSKYPDLNSIPQWKFIIEREKKITNGNIMMQRTQRTTKIYWLMHMKARNPKKKKYQSIQLCLLYKHTTHCHLHINIRK